MRVRIEIVDEESAMRRLVITLLLVGSAFSVSGCVAGCRPGYVGPYGGVHPARCAVY